MGNTAVMTSLNRPPVYRLIAYVALTGIVCGMVFSRVLLSLSMIVLILNAVISPDLRTHFKQILKSPQWWLPSLVFLQVFISLLNSDNLTDGMNWLTMKLPFLLLPIGFIPLRAISLKHLLILFSLFVLIISASVSFVLIDYYRMHNDINYWRGDVMKTPFSHIRYSLIVCMSIFIALYVFIHTHSIQRFVMLGLAIYLLLYLHVLAVRSGLVAFYLSTFILAVYYTITHKKWIEGVSFAVGLILVPVLAYNLLPTFKQKINYMHYDITSYMSSGDAVDLSDGQRLFSLEMGWKTFREHMVFGVGAGDLIDEMNRQYRDYQDIEISRRLPHNQWLWVAVSSGLFGLILFGAAMILPLWFMRKQMTWLFLVFLVILHSSMLTEATLESQIGVALYMTFYLITLLVNSGEHHD